MPGINRVLVTLSVERRHVLPEIAINPRGDRNKRGFMNFLFHRYHAVRLPCALPSVTRAKNTRCESSILCYKFLSGLTSRCGTRGGKRACTFWIARPKRYSTRCVRHRRSCFASALARQGERWEIRWDLEDRWNDICKLCAFRKSSKSSVKKLPKETADRASLIRRKDPR